MIRDCQASDAASICEIYNHFVCNSIATFEETPVTEQEMTQRIGTIIDHLPWLVSEHDGSITGFCYASPWRVRSAYRHSVETTVYLSPDFARRGIGAKLYAQLLARLRSRDIHSAVGVIALPNPASIAVHEKTGFRKVGHLHEIGRKFGQWIDVGYWQLQL
ncbi:MAG: GNAT family N-acetyltransferase [Burkholderiales bacterium]|jgi:phosphinothricin acetyltransferase